MNAMNDQQGSMLKLQKHLSMAEQERKSGKSGHSVDDVVIMMRQAIRDTVAIKK